MPALDIKSFRPLLELQAVPSSPSCFYGPVCVCFIAHYSVELPLKFLKVKIFVCSSLVERENRIFVLVLVIKSFFWSPLSDTGLSTCRPHFLHYQVEGVCPPAQLFCHSSQHMPITGSWPVTDRRHPAVQL